MNKLIISLLLFFNSVITFSQSLKKDTALLNKLLNRGNYLLSSNLDSGLIISQNCIALALKVKEKKFINQSYNLHGQVNYRLGNLDVALESFRKQEKFASNLSEKSAAIINQGNIFIEKGTNDSAILYYKIAGNIALNAKDTLDYVKTRNNIAFVHKIEGRFDSSVYYQLQALKAFEKSKNKNGIGQSYIQLAFTQYSRKFFLESKAYITKAILIYKELNDTPNLAICYTILGGVYSEINELKKAEKCLLYSLKLNLKTGDQRQIGSSYNDLAELYTHLENDNLAYLYASKALPFIKRSQSKSKLAHSYITFAKYFLNQKNYIKTKSYLDSAKLVTAANNLQSKKRLLEAEAKFYAATNQKENEIKTLKTLLLVKDTLFNTTNSEQINTLKTKYETEKKEEQIKDLSQKAKIKDLEIKQKNGILFFSLVLFIVAALGVWLFINRRQIQNRIALQNEIMRQQDIATKSILEAEERERRRIAGDLHDGVGQLLSVSLLNFNNFYNDIKDRLNPDEFANGDKLSGLINESYDEVRSISHQMMPNALLKAGLTTAVREFISKIDEHKLKVNLGISGINERLDAQTETVLYRVIQESVNNVIKHAKASLLSIQLVKDSDGINLSIEDNGIGFDKNSTKNGIGLENIKSRIALINGEIEYDTAVGKGTLVNIFIPN